MSRPERLPPTIRMDNFPEKIFMEQRTLLIVDDSADDRATLIGHLSRDINAEYQVTEAGRIADGLRSLATTKPDCVVLNDAMPDGIGLDFLRGARDAQDRIPFPIVILTAAGNQQAAVALMKAGAHDYLLKAEATDDAIRLAINNAIYKVQAERRIDDQRLELERLYREARTNNDSLRAANATKDEFLAMLSHELRTPLAPVLSLVSATLGDSTLTPDLRETFSMIQRNVELEARLIDDLLDLTQIASGRLQIAHNPVNLHSSIEAALDVCQPQIDDKKITVHTELAATNPTALGDSPRLTQVLWNLLKNAVKFSPPGGRIEVSTINEDGSVVVEIRDHGIGIEPDRLAAIFGAFSRGHPQPEVTGLGLGLAITRAIVEGHGGQIRALSEGRDRGATFRVSLPTTTTPEPMREPLAQSPSEGVRGKTIMVVEDHEDTRRVLARALRRKGYGVTAAGSVAAAVAQFSTSPPDLLISDIGLPDGTGWDLLEKLRPHGPLRAIAVSGYGMNADVEKSREIGFAAHLTKPIDFPKLETLIVEILNADAPK